MPGATRNEVIGFTDGVLRVKIAAPPVKGQANKELIAFLSDTLGIRRSHLIILKGETNREKMISVEGLTLEKIEEKLHTGTSRIRMGL